MMPTHIVLNNVEINFPIHNIINTIIKNFFSVQTDNFWFIAIDEIGIRIQNKNFTHNDIKSSNICWKKIKKGSLVDKGKGFFDNKKIIQKVE